MGNVFGAILQIAQYPLDRHRHRFAAAACEPLQARAETQHAGVERRTRCAAAARQVGEDSRFGGPARVQVLHGLRLLFRARVEGEHEVEDGGERRFQRELVTLAQAVEMHEHAVGDAVQRFTAVQRGQAANDVGALQALHHPGDVGSPPAPTRWASSVCDAGSPPRTSASSKPWARPGKSSMRRR
ncbi:MAG: hypothetical protein AW06_004219 [Candidatus Accumulibacter cognatus]|uniref:Uncharacterized protein n=1 Tax=Candidatus Accumulibacter cognatus TaxID=2954383 RepID=A0A080M0L3_9PROT|nr:MAG: hypothetical protein AW06_004219 [Candidatus Accumulibacter cognatus]